MADHDMNEHEDFDGLCEECHEKEASCTVAVMIGGQVTHRHLCGDCLAKMNATIAAGGVKHILNAIMSAMRSSAEEIEEAAPQEDAVCPRCGASLHTALKIGRVGCPECYHVFEKQLAPKLESLHGRGQHVGRMPLRTEEEQHLRDRRENLTRQMAQAVSIEDYETAALLRDQLSALKAPVPAAKEDA